MTLKIIGAGFGRTGTTSLKAALEQLGFVKCHHMTEVFRNSGQVADFIAAGDGKAVDWDKVFEGYQATTDWPSCSFYKELIDYYPDAKVVLSVRDPEKWYASCRKTIFRATYDVPAWFFALVKPYRLIQELARKQIWDGTFDGRFKDKELALAEFEKHNREVMETVPADRLLVFNVKEGWDPLCEFLDVPVPNTSFPHLNDGKVMSRFFDALPYIPWVVGGLLVVLVRYGLIWLQR